VFITEEPTIWRHLNLQASIKTQAIDSISGGALRNIGNAVFTFKVNGLSGTLCPCRSVARKRKTKPASVKQEPTEETTREVTYA
jgi:hypothetical protein